MALRVAKTGKEDKMKQWLRKHIFWVFYTPALIFFILGLTIENLNFYIIALCLGVTALIASVLIHEEKKSRKKQ